MLIRITAHGNIIISGITWDQSRGHLWGIRAHSMIMAVAPVLAGAAPGLSAMSHHCNSLKTALGVFSGQVMCYWEVAPQGRAVNSQFYCEQLHRVNQALAARNFGRVCLQQNNAPSQFDSRDLGDAPASSIQPRHCPQ